MVQNAGLETAHATIRSSAPGSLQLVRSTVSCPTPLFAALPPVHVIAKRDVLVGLELLLGYAPKTRYSRTRSSVEARLALAILLNGALSITRSVLQTRIFPPL